MNPTLIRQFVTISVLLVVSGCGPYGTLEVHVTESGSDRPIEGATVVARPSPTMRLFQPTVEVEAVTNASGIAVLHPRHSQSYDITATLDGFIDWEGDRQVFVDEHGLALFSYRAGDGSNVPGEPRWIRVELVRYVPPLPTPPPRWGEGD